MKPDEPLPERQPDTPDDAERRSVLGDLEAWLERPMQLLGFLWLALLVLELTRGLSSLLATLSTVIWVVFIADFALRLYLAPERGAYLRRNWLTAVSLLVPALRVLRFTRATRVLRATRAVRGARLVKVVGSLNRGMRALAHGMSRRGIGYVLLLTVLIVFAGAAGMFALERDHPAGPGLDDYWTALWWTAMLVTTMGSDFWPRTAEGRALCFLIALYAFGVFGYVTASLATFFVGQDANADDTELAGARDVEALRAEIAMLRSELRAGGAMRP